MTKNDAALKMVSILLTNLEGIDWIADSLRECYGISEEDHAEIEKDRDVLELGRAIVRKNLRQLQIGLQGRCRV